MTEAAPSFTVTLSQSGRSVACGPDQFVIAAALAAGVKIPFTCRRGICGTCKTRLLSGTYEMKHLGGIRPAEIEAGLFLPCCSKPTSDLVIDR